MFFLRWKMSGTEGKFKKEISNESYSNTGGVLMKVEITRYKSNSKEDKCRAGKIKTCKVEVGHGDDWSADWTIATIAAPLLKKVKENKHGAPYDNEEDVPESLRPLVDADKDDPNHPWEDENFFKRWDYILDEIIFAMEEIASDNANEPSPYTKKGEMVFGEIDEKTGTGVVTFEGYEETEESRKAYTDYRNRIKNGCRLFGVYFTDLWT